MGRRSTAPGAALCLPVWTAFMLIGSLLWSFHRLTGERLPPTVGKAGVFPHFLLTHVPAGLAGLFVAALLGAAMAMLASDMNCLSAIGVEDFLGLVRLGATDPERLQVGRAIVAASGLAAALVAVRIRPRPWRGNGRMMSWQPFCGCAAVAKAEQSCRRRT